MQITGIQPKNFPPFRGAVHTVSAAFLTILEKLGYLNNFRAWIQRIIK